MRRREAFRLAASGPVAGLLSARAAQAEARVERAVRGLPSPKITDVKAIATAPAGLRLVVVKITTDQDGLYGYGCATFTQRADLVVPAVDRYLKPFLVGKPADRIEDTWQALYASSYWRNGPVLNNAISGVDMALWDIKGRQAGLPVYQLLGGKAREAADCYAHASGAEIPEVIESARGHMSRGFRHIRVQVGVPGMAGYGSARAGAAPVKALHSAPVFEPAAYVRRALTLLETARKELGDEVELLHDVHERVTPTQALQLLQGRRALPDVLHRRPAVARGHRLVPADPPAVHDAARDGRALQQPARVDPAHLRAADRLHPHPRLAGRRPDALPQGRGSRGALRRAHRVARARRRVADRPRLQRHARHHLRRTSASRSR